MPESIAFLRECLPLDSVTLTCSCLLPCLFVVVVGFKHSILAVFHLMVCCADNMNMVTLQGFIKYYSFDLCAALDAPVIQQVQSIERKEK